MVACKPQGITAIHVFDIYSENVMRIISYRNNEGSLRVDLSDDFYSAIMTNNTEFYQLIG
jgi:hypothetical protein